MRVALLSVLVACGTNGVGTVVFTARSGSVSSVDVATGTVTDLDTGTFGEVSISPDGAYAVYVGDDWVPQLNDLHGNITRLTPAGGCCQTFRWGPNDVLTYPIIDTQKGAQLTVVVPARGGTARTLNASNVSISSDGARLAYLDRTDPSGSEIGDFVVEDLNGDHRVTIAGKATMGLIQFTPGDKGLTYVVFDETQRIERVDFSDMERQRLGTGAPVWPIAGGSRYSPDGSELLATSGRNLVGVSFADGSLRVYATIPQTSQIIAAAYLDNGAVIANLQDTQFEGDAGFTTEDVVFSLGGDVRTLQSSDGSNSCVVQQVSTEQGLLGLQCSVAALTDLTGFLITSRNAPSMLGISGDGNGMVTMDATGQIELAGTNSIVRPLATATMDGSLGIQPPFAAYAP